VEEILAPAVVPAWDDFRRRLGLGRRLGEQPFRPLPRPFVMGEPEREGLVKTMGDERLGVAVDAVALGLLVSWPPRQAPRIEAELWALGLERLVSPGFLGGQIGGVKVSEAFAAAAATLTLARLDGRALACAMAATLASCYEQEGTAPHAHNALALALALADNSSVAPHHLGQPRRHELDGRDGVAVTLSPRSGDVAEQPWAVLWWAAEVEEVHVLYGAWGGVKDHGPERMACYDTALLASLCRLLYGGRNVVRGLMPCCRAQLLAYLADGQEGR
jgi:hypothetical protein